MIVARQNSAVTATPVDLVSYSQSSNFGSGAQIGTGNYVISKTNTNSVTVNSLVPGASYHFAVYEFNGSSGPVYLVPGATGHVTTIGPPAVQATSAAISNISNTSMKLHWTNGSGNKRLVLMKPGSAVDAIPVNNAVYFANTFFSSGTQVGAGNYVVMNGIQEEVTVTNLQPGTIYHFAVFEYNDFGSTTQFLTTLPARGTNSTFVLPVVLHQFKGEVKNAAVHLTWKTAQEQNSAYFEVQRSDNATIFNTIGRLQAAGNSNDRKDYSFLDVFPKNSFNYYRLKQVDKDGNFQYSSTVAVTYEGAPVKWLSSIVTDVIELELDHKATTPTLLKIYSMKGSLLAVRQLHHGFNRIDGFNLPKGIYILQIQSGQTAEARRIIKQ